MIISRKIETVVKNCGLDIIVDIIQFFLLILITSLKLGKGDDPCKMEWINDNNLMRSHYRHCIENADVSEFSHTERRALRTTSYNLLLNNNLK